ncbi:ZN292 protein, partial [Amia calva]|nr:ZN292 protein [Amia calva]
MSLPYQPSLLVSILCSCISSSRPQTLVEYAGRWKISEDPLPLVEVYTVAILNYAQARRFLTSEYENVSLVLERLTLNCVELLLSLPEEIPDALWQVFQCSVQTAHSLQLENGCSELQMLSAIAKDTGVWANSTLRSILSKETSEMERVHEFLEQEGPVLLDMRIKQLIKASHIEKAALLAKVCSEHPEFGGKSNFKQTYLVCLCTAAPQEQLMLEISEVDCKDALEMICNLESEGDERGALSLCSAFLTRQLLQGEMYCAWELTLFWSKLLHRLEASTQVFLDHCRRISLMSKTVYHIFFLIKVIQSEVEDVGLPVCIELCVRALRMESSDNANIKATICKTISCLLPNDLEVKRACQLTEFLLEPTVDSYYAVETLYNEPDQKFEEENLPVPNSLRCELLLVFKTQWPFDPEFWDWKTLKRHCLALMGEEASIVSSIDELNDSEVLEQLEEEDGSRGQEDFKDLNDCFLDTTNVLNEIVDEKQKKREIKKLREKGFISARFRNWQAYMQYCVLCDKEFLGHRIVRHAQKHVKDGVYSCPICAENFDSKELFVPHVTSHVKQSCKERLAAMKTSRKLANPTKMPFPDSALHKEGAHEKQDCKPKKKSRPCSNDSPVSSHGDSPEGSRHKLPKPELAVHRAEYVEEYTCPVTNCRKGFKYFKNLVAHVKAHKNNEEAKRFLEMQSKKVVCQYCRRQFVSVTHLNDHLQMHCGSKPYICIQLNCRSSFLSNAELLVHRKEHVAFKAKCMFPNCGRIFYEAYMLYDHEAQHYNTFTCKAPNCGKIFHSQSQLDLHLEDHVVKQEPPANEDPDFIKTEQPDPKSPLQDPNHTVSPDSHPSNLLDFLQHETAEPSSSTSPDKTMLADHSRLQVENANRDMQDAAQDSMHESEQKLVVETNRMDTQKHEDTPAPHSSDPLLDISIQKPLAEPNQTVLEEFTQTLLPEPDHTSSQNLSRLQDPYRTILHDSHIPSQVASGVAVPNTNPVPPSVVGRVNADSSQLYKGIAVVPGGDTTGNTEGLVKAVQRYNCSFESCTRTYSSTRSVSKHMKAVHPEYYAELKLARKNKTVPRTPNRAAPSDGNPLFLIPSQEKKVKTPMSQVQKTANTPLPFTVGSLASSSSNAAFSSHAENAATQVLPTQIENIINPIILSQLGNAQIPANTLEVQSTPNASPTETMAVPKSENDALKVKRTKHNKRAKWPAIVKDGKFICCRCFREFPSPKSLGGHLSKRSHCIPFDEPDATPELRQDRVPVSFLADLINTSTLLNSHQQLLTNFNPNLPFKDQPSQSLGTGNHTDTRYFPNVIFPQANGSACDPNEVEQNGEILKQALENTGVPNLFDPSAMPQQTFQNPSASYHLDGRLPESTVIQHTGKIKKSESDCSGEDYSKAELLAAMANLSQNLVSNQLLQMTTPNSQQPLPTQGPPEDAAPIKKNVRKTLRDQILAADLLKSGKAGHVSHLSGVSAQSVLQQRSDFQNLTSVPQALDTHRSSHSSEMTQKAPNSEHKLEMNNNVMDSGSVSQGDAPGARTDNTHLSGEPSQENTTNDPGSGSATQSNDEKVAEILSALKRLDLNKESSEDSPPVDNYAQPVENLVKPFVCENEGCPYSAMTKDALFKHYSKVHNYTEDMMNEIRKNQLKFAPFRCQICNKTFTRNSNLRAHCQSVHCLSQEEMIRLKIKRPYSRKSEKEQTAAGQAMPEFIAGNHLAMEQSTAEIPVAKQTMEGQPPLTLPMRGQPAEVKATVRLPGADQPLEGQPAIGLTGAVQYLAGQHAMSCLTPGASIVTPPATGFLPAAKTAGFPLPGNPSPEKLKKPKVSKPKVDKPKIEKPKKPKEKKEKKPVAKESESNEYSPYRPYRCVHQGCFAAFTIQQNLILHYRAVHQSDLPRFDHDNEEESDEVRDEMEDETSQIKEFRCQVKDCSRIFPEVTSLLQHYVQLHKFTLDEAGALMSNMNLGRFQCDQTDCTASFTAFWKYISHIEEEHENKVIKSEGPEGLFKCDCEGCDRVYATRSNLLRHLLKKHRESHKAHLIRPRKKLGQDGGSSYRRPPKKSKFSGLKMNNGKENVQNNKKPKFKYDKKKNSDRKRGIWITVEKPVLKTSAEAIAMCTKKFPMQFPCMIKGCVSVVSSERNIFRHYTTHSLSDQYIEEQRSDFILCKKRSRHHYKDKSSRNDGETEKAGETTSETSDNEDAVETCPEGSETESSKATSSKDEVESSDTKQSTDESSETMGKRKSRRRWAFTVTNMLVKNKRGRPLKKKRKDMIQAKQRRIPERLKAKLHNEANNTCSGSESTTSSSPALPQPDQPQQNIALSTFKPMGFEVSFLKFLEESAHTPKRRAKENHSEIPSKRQRTLQQKYGNIMCRKSEAHIRARDCQNLIDFRNPLNLKSVKNVKIVVDKTFSDGAELLLKQLQEMRPIVILKKWLYS